MVWLGFALCLLVILFAGRRLARYGDIIAEKTGLGGAWTGTVLTAMATSLPELFTGISSVTLVGAPDLTVGNLLGANTFNLVNLAIIDIAFRDGAVLRARSPVHQLTMWSGLVLVAIASVSIAISQRVALPALGWVGWYTPAIVVLYLAFARAIFYAERKSLSLRAQEETMMAQYGEVPVRSAYLHFAIAAVLVIGAGVFLARIGDDIAAATGWGRSFVGSLLLAFTTTLPEISVSTSAMRIGAVDLAIANLAGSNLFNMVIIGVDDLFYLRGPVLNDVSANHLVTALTVVLMALALVGGLRFRPARRWRLTWWNVTMIAVFLAGAYVSFSMAS